MSPSRGYKKREAERCSLVRNERKSASFVPLSLDVLFSSTTLLRCKLPSQRVALRFDCPPLLLRVLEKVLRDLVAVPSRESFSRTTAIPRAPQTRKNLPSEGARKNAFGGTEVKEGGRYRREMRREPRSRSSR